MSENKGEKNEEKNQANENEYSTIHFLFIEPGN
jgi:hypothetical protein